MTRAWQGLAGLWGRASGPVQRQVLEQSDHLRAFAVSAAVWLAARLTGCELTFTSVRERASPNRTHTDLCLDKAGDLDGLAAHAKAQVAGAAGRRAVVTGKCKALFTFNAALLALIAVFQARAAGLRSWEVGLFYLAVIAFVWSLLVVWTYFDIGGEAVTPLEQALVGLGKDDLKKSLINSHLRCATDFDSRTDFLVDLYPTSRFLLMSGFVLLFIVFSHSYFARGGGVAEEPAPVKAPVAGQ